MSEFYVRKKETPHMCLKPFDNSVVKGDIWECECLKRYRCSGWLWVGSGAIPLWYRWYWPWPK